MKHSLRLIMLAILLLASPLWASQGGQDGHKLYESCKLAQAPQDGVANREFDYDDYYAIGYCHGIVQGVSESMANQKRFCLPDDVRFPQLTLLVADYLTDQPAKRSLTATQAAYNALLSRYPCIINP